MTQHLSRGAQQETAVGLPRSPTRRPHAPGGVRELANGASGDREAPLAARRCLRHNPFMPAYRCDAGCQQNNERTGGVVAMNGGSMTLARNNRGRNPGAAIAAWLVLGSPLVQAYTPTPDVQKAVRAATFEVVLRKMDKDPLSYEKPLPLELIPYVVRNDQYWSIGSAFAIGPNTYVSAAHVLLATVGSQFGAPALRDSAGHVYPVDRVLKFSAQEDFVVFTLTGAPDAIPLQTTETRALDEVVLAAGNALGEGVVMRDGLLTSETPEAQDGRWKWLRFSAAASPGNSGGPLLDESGKVIGVVDAKSPNENLNYALPIGLVLASPAQAQFDVRYSVKLPNARNAGVATLKTQFALPKSFAQFAQAYQEVTLTSMSSELQKLQVEQASQLFPHGDSAKLLATVYDSPLPVFIQQTNTDAWDAVGAENTVDQDLPNHGLISTGTSMETTVFRLKRPGAASDDRFYADSQQFMDLLLKGMRLPRQVGDQSIRVTSLGRPSKEDYQRDKFGRRWKVMQWPLGYVDSYLICYALPVPEGYVGMVHLVPSSGVLIANEYLKLMTDLVYVNYSGTLPQWRTFLARADLRPSLFDHIKLDLSDKQSLGYESQRLTLRLPRNLVNLSDDSQIDLRMAYLLNGEKLVWDVAGVYVFADQDRKTYVGLERHVKPASESDKALTELWERMSTHGPGFNRVAGHDESYEHYWIHDALGAPGSSSVLYDVYYGTQSSVYPREMEDTERNLTQATHVLER
jgi:S1-C subfamily serine protease